jgi:hypothetical protein
MLIRKAAMLACSIALNTFLVFSPAATATTSAVVCQEDCNDDAAACNSNCDFLYTHDSDDWHACRQQCGSDWNACSMNAECCNRDCYTWCSWRADKPDEVTCSTTCTGCCLP